MFEEICFVVSFPGWVIFQAETKEIMPMNKQISTSIYIRATNRFFGKTLFCSAYAMGLSCIG